MLLSAAIVSSSAVAGSVFATEVIIVTGTAINDFLNGSTGGGSGGGGGGGGLLTDSEEVEVDGLSPTACVDASGDTKFLTGCSTPLQGDVSDLCNVPDSKHHATVPSTDSNENRKAAVDAYVTKSPTFLSLAIVREGKQFKFNMKFADGGTEDYQYQPLTSEKVVSVGNLKVGNGVAKACPAKK